MTKPERNQKYNEERNKTNKGITEEVKTKNEKGRRNRRYKPKCNEEIKTEEMKEIKRNEETEKKREREEGRIKTRRKKAGKKGRKEGRKNSNLFIADGRKQQGEGETESRTVDSPGTSWNHSPSTIS